ncbi:MAG: pyridoxal-phosphate dependent enzyme [Nitrososphaerales archaeon]
MFKKREDVVDDFYTITNGESFRASKELFEKEKLLVGPFSGCVMEAAKNVAENINEGVIAVIFADDGRKFKSLYLNQNIFSGSEFEKALKECRMLIDLPFNPFK